jgi:hypothetical protein
VDLSRLLRGLGEMHTKKRRKFGSPVTLVRGGKTNACFNKRDEGR